MDDLISRQDAIDALAELQGKASTKAELKGISKVWKRIKKLPSAQPELVRCKDCKWYQINELKKDGTEDRRYKPSVCVLAAQRRDPNHFCADGKKREES